MKTRSLEMLLFCSRRRIYSRELSTFVHVHVSVAKFQNILLNNAQIIVLFVIVDSNVLEGHADDSKCANY